MNAPLIDDTAERRARQRFVARRRGNPCFWVVLDGQRVALNDLSLEGFSLPALPTLSTGSNFQFVLQRDGIPDEINGWAEVVNQIADGGNLTAGCRFTTLDEAGAERLNEWLVAHVIVNATVRISEKDAAAIVRGRSLV